MHTHKIGRREALAIIGAAGAAAALGCSNALTSPSGSTTSSSSTTDPTSTNAACAVTPSETAGPYPSLTSLIRSDIREDRQGIPLTLTIKVVNASASCAPLASADVEIWHADVAGNYSEYSSERSKTYLRGVQATDGSGQVVFTTIYPGWYQGRATHIHVEVKINGVSRKVTQMAFTEAVNNAVYATGVYASRGVNPTSNASDGIFTDSLSSELVTPAGSPASGYTATFQVGIAG
jgi:protocatechuate 3,4-dioxygenase beta subunit